LIKKEEEKAMFCPAGKFDLCPILDVMGNADKNKEKPNVTPAKIGPAEGGEASDDDKNVKEKSPAILEF